MIRLMKLLDETKVNSTGEDNSLKVEDLTLVNFRRFKKFSMDFHPQLTVVVAKNGQGKTSVLDGLGIALGTFVGAFDLGRGKSIARTDALYKKSSDSSTPDTEQAFPVEVRANLTIQGKQPIEVLRTLNGVRNRTSNRFASQLTDFGKSLMTKVRDLEDVTLPVISYYGSGRLWVVHSVSRERVLTSSRTMGYEDCLTAASSFKQLQEWMRKATTAVLQQYLNGSSEDDNLRAQVESVEGAVNNVFEEEDWIGFRYSLSHEDLVMGQGGDDRYLSVSLLSDGVRALVSLVADLAWRCTKLNPQFGLFASENTPGIVMIDEVDLHLHPAWQQTILPRLIKEFPRIQFIVTTHSPQVLSTVERECIRVISFDEDGSSGSEMPLAMSYGEESQNVLQAIMGIDPQPPVPERDDLRRLTSLIESGEFNTDEANGLMQKLQETLSKNHPQLQRLQRSIERQEALNK